MNCEKCGEDEADIRELGELPVCICNSCCREYVKHKPKFRKLRQMYELYSKSKALEAQLTNGDAVTDDFVKVSIAHTLVCKEYNEFIHNWLIGKE